MRENRAGVSGRAGGNGCATDGRRRLCPARCTDHIAFRSGSAGGETCSHCRGRRDQMTFEEKIKDMLVANMVPDNMAGEIVKAVKEDKANDAMKGRWQDDMDAYPPSMIAILWVSTRRTALEYIDEHIPLAWFRPLFVEGES